MDCDTSGVFAIGECEPMNNHKAAILNDFIRIQIAPDYVRAQLKQPDEFDRLIIRCREIREDFTYWLVIEALIARHEFELVSLITGYQTLFSFSIDSSLLS